MKITKVKAKTIEEYKALSKKEREVFGFYRNPTAMIYDPYNGNGWSAFEEYVKKEYPIQAFFREELALTLSIWWDRYYKRPKMFIKRFIKPNHPRFRNAYQRHEYKDVDMIIEDSLFALLKDFWYEECWPKSIVEWHDGGEGEKVYNWMKESVETIEVTIPKLNAEYNDLLSKAMEMSGTYDEKYSEADKIQARIKELTDDILHKMIEYRDFLWT